MLNRKKNKIFLMKRKNLLRYLCKIKSSCKNRRLIKKIENKRGVEM